MDKVRVGITIGDINGIGPEVIIKTLANEQIMKYCHPIIYGSSKTLAYHKNIVKKAGFGFTVIKDASQPDQKRPSLVNCWKEDVNIQLGTVTEQGGSCAHKALDMAIADAKAEKIHAIVTAPIHKKAMGMTGFPYPGHTEYLAQAFDASEMMLMTQDDLRIGLCTVHIPIKEVAAQLSKELIKKRLDLFRKSLIQDFGIEKPNIAVLGLNPHASDDGLMGTEENEFIRPLLISYRKNGALVAGPFAADGFFGSKMYRRFDGILAMYHDQGLIPFKTLAFGQGVNTTIGLPIVRTSPDHGTGFEIAGKNMADPGSFRAALFQAIDMYRQRKTYKENKANPLQRKQRRKDEEHTST